MLLIYAKKTSPRLQFSCRFVFAELLKTPFSLTLHEESFIAHDGPKINYSDRALEGAYKILPAGLLFETGITKQETRISREGKNAVLFGNTNDDHGFDIFAGIFFLISRYEEYLPYEKDDYGRYPHQNSVAFRHGFLNIPLVNIWVNELSSRLQLFFAEHSTVHQPAASAPDFQPSSFNQRPSDFLQPSTFNFLPTYDIDIAWSFKEKGFARNLAGFLRSPSTERIGTLLGLKHDPYDSYEFMDYLHKKFSRAPLYFFPVAEIKGKYDKNIEPSNEQYRRLIRRHAAHYCVGLHPSWKSNELPSLLAAEKDTLEQIIDKPLILSRQHYIKFELPATFETLLAAGIREDYSMGYGSINGFRASVASAFSFYDLQEEKVTPLRVYPFCFMDANCFYEQKLSVDEAYNELLHYFDVCKNAGGTLITIFHNNFLGSDKLFAGWPQMYERFLSHVSRHESRTINA